MVINFTPINHLLNKNYQTKNVGTTSKENPVFRSKESSNFQEVVEHELSNEVKPFVQVKPTSIELPPDLKKIGLQSITTTQFPTYQNIKLPISDDKVLSGLHAPLTSSVRWLSMLAMYVLQKAHLSLRIAKGHVVRVFKR